jgi:hypothetical protein
MTPGSAHQGLALPFDRENALRFPLVSRGYDARFHAGMLTVSRHHPAFAWRSTDRGGKASGCKGESAPSGSTP